MRRRGTGRASARGWMGGGGGGEPLVEAARVGGARTHLRILSSNTARRLSSSSLVRNPAFEKVSVSARPRLANGRSRGAAVTEFARPRTHHSEKACPPYCPSTFTFLAEGALGRAEGRLLAEGFFAVVFPIPRWTRATLAAAANAKFRLGRPAPAGGRPGPSRKSETTCVRSSAASQRPTRRSRRASRPTGPGRARTLGARRARRRARGLNPYLGRARNDTPFPRGGGVGITARAFTTRWRSRAGRDAAATRSSKRPSASPRMRRSRSFSAR